MTGLHHVQEVEDSRHPFVHPRVAAHGVLGRPAPVVVLTQFAQATRLLDGVTVVEAANVYNARKEPPVKRKLVSEVIEELLNVKRQKGRSFLYLKDLRLRLDRVARVFRCPLADVTADAIDRFLLDMDAAPRTRNNFRLVIGTLLRFGQVRGYVAKDHPGICVIEKASHTDGEVVVFTPTEIKRC